MNIKFKRGSAVFKQLAFKQTKVVVLVSFTVGLIMSIIQVYLDLQTHKNTLETSIEQYADVVRQPAAQAAYHLDTQLADEVAKGLFNFRSVIEVEISDDLGNELTTQKRERQKKQKDWLSEFFFGDTTKYQFTLRNADDTIRIA